MTPHETVYNFLKQNLGVAFCDDCIAKATGVAPLEVPMAANATELFPGGFKRAKASCHRCDADFKMVTVAN